AGTRHEALHRVEEPFGPFPGFDRKVRPRGIADEERVAREDEIFSDHEGAMLGTVPGRVDDLDRDGTGIEFLSILERLKRELRFGQRVDGDRYSVLQREASVAGDVVSVGVSLEHADDPNSLVPRGLQVLLD